MAESCDKAFGRYLRTLRERRGLTLDGVGSLSQAFPESIGKGYLSRCENGYQKPAFSKVIALSRIYEVPADVLVERMELDMELDRVGGPETEGMDFSGLTLAGKDAIQRGYRWNAYGYLRDAVRRASVDPVRPTFRDRNEQLACALMSCGTAARSLGRHRFALHEFLYLETTGWFSDRTFPLLLERASSCYLDLDDLDRADMFALRAVNSATGADDDEFLAYALYTRARVALRRTEYNKAIDYFKRAHDVHQAAGRRADCALTLNSLAQCYFDTRRFKAARRAVDAAKAIARETGQHRTIALSLIMLGQLDEMSNKIEAAIKAWRDALSIGRQLDDRELRFQAEALLYRRALADGEAAVARAIRRRLLRLAPWIQTPAKDLAALTEPEGFGQYLVPEVVSVTKPGRQSDRN